MHTSLQAGCCNFYSTIPICPIQFSENLNITINRPKREGIYSKPQNAYAALHYVTHVYTMLHVLHNAYAALHYVTHVYTMLHVLHNAYAALH